MTRRPEEAPSGAIGRKAPAFTLPDQHGKAHKLSDYKGKRVVLFWYPKDDTPGVLLTHRGFSYLTAWRRRPLGTA